MGMTPEQRQKLKERLNQKNGDNNSGNGQQQPQVIIYQEAPKKKKRTWLKVLVVLLILGSIGAAGNSRKSKTQHGEPVAPVGSGSTTKADEGSTTKTDEGTVAEEASQEQEAAPVVSDEPQFEVTNTIFKVYRDELFDEYRYDALLEIENTGLKNIYIKSDAQFDIEDADGHLIQTDKVLSNCPDVILPGEKGYLYNTFGSSMESVSDPDSVRLFPHYTIETTDKTPHEFPVTDTSVKDDTFGKTVVGRLTNDTDEEVSYIYVNVLYYNSDGICVGVGGTSVTSVAPGDTKSFEISGIGAPHGYEDDLADYKVIARDMFLGW